MKKLLPIIAIVGIGAMVGFKAINNNNTQEVFTKNLDSFNDSFKNYSQVNDQQLVRTALDKYALTVSSDAVEILENKTPQLLDKNETETQINSETSENISDDVLEENDTIEIEENNTPAVSTLYSLSNDIENSCNEFCALKEQVTNAIIETESLIEKIKNNEIELSKEQKMFITEQSSQLKNLGKQLSNITTELSFYLSDLNQIMLSENGDIDTLNLKYLVVLDNLVNGNEMLMSSLSSLNLINQMFNMKETLPSNNTGRILYGFQKNDEPAIIKDYYINENGDLIDNSPAQPEITEEHSKLVEEEKKLNIDTYANSNLSNNIDTYNNMSTPSNIDSFFNTALLDNQFMYGNNNYGYNYGNRLNNYQNPYISNPNTVTNSNTINSIDNTNNQQDDETKKSNKEEKKIKLKKNIDTYKDENEPTIKTKLTSIKNSISDFFSQFNSSNKVDLNDKIDNPIYRFKSEQND